MYKRQDHIIITDNLSNDGTEDVLQDYSQKENITLIHEKDNNYEQSAWVTRMARLAQDEHRADWVLHSDCDEFFVPYNGYSLQEVLAGYSQSIDYLNIYRHDFVAINDNNDGIRGMIYKKAVSKNIFGRVLPPKVIHRNLPQVSVSQGNHSILFPSNLVSLDCLDIEIFHYPIRSKEQFESKILLGGHAYENNESDDKQMGSTWRHLYDKMQEGNFEEVIGQVIYTPNRVKAAISSGELLLDESLTKILR